MATNPFREDSWEWHAYEVALWASAFKVNYDRTLTDLWEQVFVDDTDLDWPIQQLATEAHRLAIHATSGTKYGDLVEMVQVLARKQYDYGPLNITMFGREGIKVRTWDKVARIGSLTARGSEGTVEPLHDAYFDLWGYCVLLRMLQLGVFEKTLTADIVWAEGQKQPGPVSEETTFPVEVCYGDLVAIKMMFDGSKACHLPGDEMAYVYEIVRVPNA